jgi:hypothetical protein
VQISKISHALTNTNRFNTPATEVKGINYLYDAARNLRIGRVDKVAASFFKYGLSDNRIGWFFAIERLATSNG